MAERRDVVIAEVFFFDEPDSKVRPCVILSDRKYHESGYCIVALVTTENDEYCLPVSNADANCDFYPGSGVRFDCISRIPLELIEKYIGRVKSEFHQKLMDKMMSMLK